MTFQLEHVNHGICCSSEQETPFVVIFMKADTFDAIIRRLFGVSKFYLSFNWTVIPDLEKLKVEKEFSTFTRDIRNDLPRNVLRTVCFIVFRRFRGFSPSKIDFIPKISNISLDYLENTYLGNSQNFWKK